MKAAVLQAPGSLEVVERAAPASPHDALVAVRRVGICGTDLKIASGAIPVTAPRVVGHEIVGTVMTAVSGSPPAGAAVLVDPAVACERCDVCRSGRRHLCPHGGLLGREFDGGAAESIAVSAELLHLIPPSVDLDSQTLLQVLGTCVHAQNAVSVRPGEPAVVVGLGVSGLLHLQLLLLRGAHPVVGVTRSADTRALAAALGADLTVTPAEAAQAVAQATRGRGAHLVVEAVGAPEAVALATDAAAFGATLLRFGISAGEADGLPTYEWCRKELTVVNPRAASGFDYDAAVELAAAGKVQLAQLVTECYPLPQVAVAFLATGRPGVLKVALDLR